MYFILFGIRLNHVTLRAVPFRAYLSVNVVDNFHEFKKKTTSRLSVLKFLNMLLLSQELRLIILAAGSR